MAVVAAVGMPDNRAMRIDLHTDTGQRLGWVEVDEAQPPSVVRFRTPGIGEVEHYLEWERVFDDEGQLRRCPGCGCELLYHQRSVPALTGFVIVLVVGLVCGLLYGFSDAPLWLLGAALGVVTAANFVITLRAAHLLACYRCGTRFFGAKIARQWREWDAATADTVAKRTQTWGARL